MSFEVRGRWETPSYFFVYLRVSSFQLVAPRATCLRCRVVAHRDAITMQRADAAK